MVVYKRYGTTVIDLNIPVDDIIADTSSVTPTKIQSGILVAT